MKVISIGSLIAVVALLVGVSGCSDSEAPQDAVAVKTVNGPAITGADRQQKAASPAIVANPSLPPLPIEELGKIAVLPKSYPESWILVNELSFFSMYGGKVLIMDAAEKEPQRRIKGTIDKYMMGNFTQSPKRGEYYVLETFHERGSRGKRTDVLSIYDKSTLILEKEIVWPKPGRMQALPERYAMSVSGDERFLFAANFNPAASITVIDLDTREIVDQIATPGCVLAYPMGDRGIASVCSNGAMLSTAIDDNGKLAEQKLGSAFFDTIKTPIFEHPVYVDGKAYFPSFTGLLHVFDMSSTEARYEGSWDLVDEASKGDNWRPSGLILNDVDDAGLMYTIFQPDGHEGSQTHGGTQVWVYDLKARKRVKVIETPNWAISIGVTRGERPLLIVANGDMNLDVFDAKSGEHLHTMADFGNVTPLAIDGSY